MGRFDDMLSSLGRGEDGSSVAYPDTFLDDISGAYSADMEGPTAKIAVLEADLAAALKENDGLKAHNYDLLMQIPASTSPEGEQKPEEEEPPAKEEEPSKVDKIFAS